MKNPVKVQQKSFLGKFWKVHFVSLFPDHEHYGNTGCGVFKRAVQN